MKEAVHNRQDVARVGHFQALHENGRRAKEDVKGLKESL